MRKFMSTMLMATGLAIGTVAGAHAAPVSGYGAEQDAVFATLYSGVVAACSGEGASATGCRQAIGAYSGQLVAGGVPFEVANGSFAQLREDIAEANSGDTAMLATVDAVFEELLPESGDIGPQGASQTL